MYFFSASVVKLVKLVVKAISIIPKIVKMPVAKFEVGYFKCVKEQNSFSCMLPNCDPLFLLFRSSTHN